MRCLPMTITFRLVALIYMSDWLAETFQLRLSFSETAIRPDLREVTDANIKIPLPTNW